MTDSALPPTTSLDEEDIEDAQAHERIETDPEQEPNAPNREHQQEFVRHDQRAESLDPASDDDELDHPDKRPE
jgi:hypothetical protein